MTVFPAWYLQWIQLVIQGLLKEKGLLIFPGSEGPSPYIPLKMEASNSLVNFNGNPNLVIDFISRYLTPDARRQADGRLFPPSMMTDIHVKCRDPYEYTYRDIKGQIKRIKRHPVPAGSKCPDIPLKMSASNFLGNSKYRISANSFRGN